MTKEIEDDFKIEVGEYCAIKIYGDDSSLMGIFDGENFRYLHTGDIVKGIFFVTKLHFGSKTIRRQGEKK